MILKPRVNANPNPKFSVKPSAVTASSAEFFVKHASKDDLGKPIILDPTWLERQTPTSLHLALTLLSKPLPPEDGNCCMSGCAVCVWDLYSDEFDEYTAKKRKLKAALALKSNAPLKEEPEESPAQIDPSIQAFRDLERQLADKRS